MINEEKIRQTFNAEIHKCLKLDNVNLIYVYRIKRNESEFLLKLVTSKNAAKIQLYQKEVAISNIISTYLPNLHAIHALECGYLDNYFWVLREYMPGESLCQEDSISDTSRGLIYTLSNLKENFVSQRNSIIPIIANNIKILESSKGLYNNIKTTSWNRRFCWPINANMLENIPKPLKSVFEQSLRFKENGYLSEESLCLSVSDLIPSNILISSGGEIYFFDFEWMCLDNYTTDMSMLWLFLWRYPDWQNELIYCLELDNNSKNYFLISVAKIIANWYAGIDWAKLEDKTEINQAKYQGYIDHIWVKYIKAAGESFEALMNVRQ